MNKPFLVPTSSTTRDIGAPFDVDYHETGLGPQTHRSYDESTGRKKTYHPKSVGAKSNPSERASVLTGIERQETQPGAGHLPRKATAGARPRLWNVTRGSRVRD